MKKVNGVLGPIDTKDIGYTLMHEHILSVDWSMRVAFKDWIVYDEFIELAVREVNMAKKIGIRTIVDATPINLGRDIIVLRDVAKKTGMEIIASTGFYCDETSMLKTQSEKTLSRLLLREIEEGMQGTDTKAGLIKVATDLLGVTELNRKFLKASASAHKSTGVPIYTHASISNQMGIAQQDILEDEGVDLRNVIIGHVGDCNDIDYMEKLMNRGSYIGLDRFGHDEAYKIYNTKDRIDTFVELCKRGWVDKLIVSHDFVCYLDYFDNEWDKLKNVDINNLPYDFCFFNKKVIPQLLDKGITREQIDTVMIDNPRRFFEQ
jgi:phosphotriesterase-related protein